MKEHENSKDHQLLIKELGKKLNKSDFYFDDDSLLIFQLSIEEVTDQLKIVIVDLAPEPFFEINLVLNDQVNHSDSNLIMNLLRLNVHWIASGGIITLSEDNQALLQTIIPTLNLTVDLLDHQLGKMVNGAKYILRTLDSMQKSELSSTTHSLLDNFV